ncbi:MAG: dethiobiotin synthase [Magnetococcus sp. MYC-9]
MAGFFVTGTDTGVGKSVVSAWLMQRQEATYWKPVQSGALPGEETDTVFVRRLSGLPEERFHASAYTLALPRSPHEAARHEGVEIRMERLQLPVGRRPWVVEGAGGVLVPLNGQHLMVDLMVQLGLPVILVARTTLGTINHTLLSLACLRSRGLTVAGVILNGIPDAENRRAIRDYGQATILADLPLLDPLHRETLLGTPGYLQDFS